MKYWLGIEIGGTKQQIGIVGDDGSVIKKQSGKPALVRGAQDILDWMESEIPHLTDGYEICGAGIGFGGVLDSGKGTSVCSVQVPGWKDFPIRDRFSEMLLLPCTVVNDTVCGGYAELNVGSGRGKKIFAYTNIGTGCGGSAAGCRTSVCPVRTVVRHERHNAVPVPVSSGGGYPGTAGGASSDRRSEGTVSA